MPFFFANTKKSIFTPDGKIALFLKTSCFAPDEETRQNFEQFS